MMDLILLYKWTLPAACVFAGALALLGCQLAARDRAMQTVCVSQGAMLGVLLALGLSPQEHTDPESHLIPFSWAAGMAALTFLGTDFLARKKSLSKNTLFAAVFAVLLASGYFVSALFPALESHMAQVYFGDLATLTEYDAKVTLVLGTVCLAVLVGFRRRITGQSFELAIFGHAYSRTQRRWAVLFNALSLALLCYSVQFLGFLFSIALLFLPTTVLNLGSPKGLARHLGQVSAGAMAGAVGGFLISLQFTRFPTVPTVTLATLSVCLVIKMIDSGAGKLAQ